MDMANFVSARLGVSGVDQFERMHPTLLQNITGFENVGIPVNRLLAALSRDKKNTATHLRLVLVDHQGRIGLTDVDPNGMLPDAVAEYLQTIHDGRLHEARIG